MRKSLILSVMALLVLSVMPAVLAVSVGTGVGIDITTEQFAPRVWMCDNRVVYDDNTEPGRLFPLDEDGSCSVSTSVTLPGNTSNSAVCTAAGGTFSNKGTSTNYADDTCVIYYETQISCEQHSGVWTASRLLERINNYAFEGEQITWDVLVMDKNKIDQNIDVYATIGDVQGEGNDIEVNCQRISDDNISECNARIQEENLVFDSDTMSKFRCTFSVETPESMYGEYWITVEAQDGDGLMGTMDENEYWFLNPEIALSIDGDLAFDEVRPGTSAYSDTLLVGNNADESSGVMMDMFISGTDFYDSTSSGARCPTTNQLALSNFRYYVTNGAYNSAMDLNNDLVDGNRDTDAEGYTNIDYAIGFNNPNVFYDNMEILQAQKVSPYYTANLLAPGAEMALTFKLDMPEPCNGDFDSGSIYFWGEAI